MDLYVCKCRFKDLAKFTVISSPWDLGDPQAEAAIAENRVALEEQSSGYPPDLVDIGITITTLRVQVPKCKVSTQNHSYALRAIMLSVIVFAIVPVCIIIHHHYCCG